MIKNIAAALVAATVLSASPALAVTSPFGGSSTGVDPLGHAWSASGSRWGEPGYGLGTLTFNTGGLTDQGSETYATSFSFTYNAGVTGIDTTPSTDPFGFLPYTRFTNLTDGVAWDVSFDGKSVIFTAPTMAAKLDVGDQFFVNVAFTSAIDSKRFSFAGLWDELPVGSVPEPASWALMLAGFGLTGGALRRRQSGKVAFAV